MKKIRIAQIAPLWISIPPRTYGGIELMLSELTESLVRRGQDVTLIASGDSATSAKLIPVVERGIWSQKDNRNPHAPIIRMLKVLFDRFYEFDLLHNHFNFFPLPLTLRIDAPVFLTTVHRPIDEEYAKTMLAYPKSRYCAISQDHKKSMEEFGIPVADVIYNGLDVNTYEFNDTPEDYVVYLGRLNKEKGVITAIEAAQAAGQNIVVAGNVVGNYEWLYFLHEVQPLLNSEDHTRFRGEVTFKDKVNLLKNAKALLFPIDRREPFGLVMIEAMACGTPVIAFNRGSVPEVVEHGKTGFVVNTKEEMVSAMKNINQIERQACRKRVEENFGLEQMVDKYEQLYERLLG